MPISRRSSSTSLDLPRACVMRSRILTHRETVRGMSRSSTCHPLISSHGCPAASTHVHWRCQSISCAAAWQPQAASSRKSYSRRFAMHALLMSRGKSLVRSSQSSTPTATASLPSTSSSIFCASRSSVARLRLYSSLLEPERARCGGAERESSQSRSDLAVRGV